MARGVFNLFKPRTPKPPTSSAFAEELDRARSVFRQGGQAEALSICREILKRQPDHVEALFLTADIAATSGESDRALQIYEQLLAIKPEHALAHYKRGNLLKDRQQLEAALDSYDKAVALDPRFAYAFCNRGFVLERMQRWDDALHSYDQAIALAPDDSLAHFNRAAILRELGRREDALASLTQAIAAKRDYFEAFANRGLLLTEMKRWDEALDDFAKSIELNAAFGPAHCGRGTIHQLRRQWDAALTSFDRAIGNNPGDALAHRNRGDVLTELRQWNGAKTSIERAIALKPDFAEAYHSLALLLSAAGYSEAALTNFDKAIGLKSDYADAYLNRANLLVGMKRFLAAVADYDRGLDLQSDSSFVSGMRCYAKMNVCDWRNLAADLERLISGIEAGEKLSPPLPLLALVDSLSVQYKAARIWVQESFPPSSELPPLAARVRSDKPRIGYFSGDFHDHPVAVLTAGLFEAHDRSKLSYFAFSYGPNAPGDLRRRLEGAFDQFIDVRGKSDREIALLARELKIDIAVDLGGHSGHSRTGIFAMRAAPLQVNYLGFAGTMGADYMDYLIADETVVPVAHEPHYAEKIVRLPASFLPHDATRRVAAKHYSREELGLPSDVFVYCCFNNNFKITPEVFDGWMRILTRVPNSVLWLSQNNEAAVDNLRQEAVRRGIQAARLIFAGRMPSPADHLARQRAADLFLDTRPYNAHATAIDALWSGLPLLTLPGEGFASRVAASLLKAVSLPELIATSAANYEEIAVQMAENPQLLLALKGRLAQSHFNSPLFDTHLFAQRLESAYLAMLERFHAGLSPGSP